MKKANIKRLLNTYSILVIILIFIFYFTRLINNNTIKLLLAILCMNIIIFSGIIGLKTNAIIIGRGDIEYTNTSIWGKICNYFLISFGVVFIIIALIIYII